MAGRPERSSPLLAVSGGQRAGGSRDDPPATHEALGVGELVSLRGGPSTVRENSLAELNPSGLYAHAPLVSIVDTTRKVTFANSADAHRRRGRRIFSFGPDLVRILVVHVRIRRIRAAREELAQHTVQSDCHQECESEKDPDYP